MNMLGWVSDDTKKNYRDVSVDLYDGYLIINIYPVFDYIMDGWFNSKSLQGNTTDNCLIPTNTSKQNLQDFP